MKVNQLIKIKTVIKLHNYSPLHDIPCGKILELVGTPITELTKPEQNHEAGHYVISQLEQRLKLNQLEVLPDTFMIRVFQKK